MQPGFRQETGGKQHEQGQPAEQVLDRLRDRPAASRPPSGGADRKRAGRPRAGNRQRSRLPSAATTVGSAPKRSIRASSIRWAASKPGVPGMPTMEKPPIRKAMATKGMRSKRPPSSGQFGGTRAPIDEGRHQQQHRHREAEVPRQQQRPTPSGCSVNRPITIRLVWLTTARRAAAAGWSAAAREWRRRRRRWRQMQPRTTARRAPRQRVSGSTKTPCRRCRP